MLAPVALGVLVLVVWHLVVVAFAVPAFLLPTPLAIAQQFVAQFPVILSTAAVTGGNALVGLVAGFLIGLVLAVLAASSRLIAELTTPVVLAASAIPIVALAPVFTIMFGSTTEIAAAAGRHGRRDRAGVRRARRAGCGRSRRCTAT